MSRETAKGILPDVGGKQDLPDGRGKASEEKPKECAMGSER